MWKHQNLHSMSGCLYEMKQSDHISDHFCKHMVVFIHFTFLFSMAVFSLFLHSINCTLDWRHPLSPPPKCFTFFSVYFREMRSCRFLCSHRWGISDQCTHVYIHEHPAIPCTCIHFPSGESALDGAVWAQKVLTSPSLLSNFLVCNWLPETFQLTDG